MDRGGQVSGLGGAGTFPLPEDPYDVADFVRALRAVKVWAGDPSMAVLRRRTGVATSTLSDAFNPQRRQLPSLDLVRLIVRACGADPSQVAGWERAWRRLREQTADAAATTALPHAGPGPRADGHRTLASLGQDGWVPRQLPADVPGFIGRTDALTALAARPATATVITGTAGVGKTALAVHRAHQITDRYPDGQLYLDLRGHSADPAITPTQALSLLLQSLGIPGERIPVDLHLQISLYRSVLAERRILILLDNVADTAHARPLLPGGPGCHALITSRDALTGLVVREGATRITLDTLTPTESHELLATHLGSDRVGAEPDATVELAHLCAHLPLALRISAANLAARPNQTIAGTVRELARTDLLERLSVVGDPQSAVAAAFDLSYRSLPEPAELLFRLLGLVPGPEVDREAAAILLGRDPGDPDDAVGELDELLTAHLLFEPSPGRYRMHDLLALYARHHADTEPAKVREETLHRLLSWYLLNIDAATQIIFSTSTAVEDLAELELTGVARNFSGPADARAWLEAEMPNLVMAVTHTAEHGPAPFAWHLANRLRGYLLTRASGVQHLAIAQAALRAAEARGDVKGQVKGHVSLGLVASAQGDLKGAFEEFETALVQSIPIQYTRGIEMARNNLANTCLRRGDINRAVDYIEEILQIQPVMTLNKILTLSNLAMTSTIRGNHTEALRLGYECLAFVEQADATRLITVVKRGLALTQLALGDPVTAEKLLLEAHLTAMELGSAVDSFDILAGLVLVCVRTGRLEEAFSWMTPLRELVERGVPSFAGDDWAHAAIIETYLAAGRLDEALALGEPALAQYDRAGHQLTALRVRILLGRVHRAQGNHEAARGYWESALPYTVEQSLPDRAAIDGLLADL